MVKSFVLLVPSVLVAITVTVWEFISSKLKSDKSVTLNSPVVWLILNLPPASFVKAYVTVSPLSSSVALAVTPTRVSPKEFSGTVLELTLESDKDVIGSFTSVTLMVKSDEFLLPSVLKASTVIVWLDDIS